MTSRRFNSPPGWPVPPAGWTPGPGWTPDPSWPEPPEGWQLWIDDEAQPAGVQESNEAKAKPDSTRSLPPSEAGAFSGISQRNPVSDDVVQLDDEAVLQSVGIYRYHHPLENAAMYRDRLDELEARIAQLVKDGRAIEASTMFTFDNSLAKGRKMTNDLGRLMLRAYNAEAENAIAKLRAGNVLTAKRRLERSRDQIAKLGLMMEMRISDDFHALRFEEIELTADWLMKKQEERQAAQEEKARLREERRAQKELEEERERLEKERQHHLRVIAELREQGEDTGELQAALDELDAAIEQNDYRAANIRAGYVYVISNRGAFGEGVMKIGLTRRLDPYDRIRELGSASVPFRFDVHALFFSEDAVSLEAELHRHFADRAVNRVNSRKEFFFATPAEVRDVLEERVGSLLEFTDRAEATEFFQSVGEWPELPQAA